MKTEDAYFCCINADRRIYKSYFNNDVNAVDMHREDLDGIALICFPVEKSMRVKEDKN